MTCRMPAGWQLVRLRHVATLNPTPSESLQDDDEVSFLPMEAIGEDGTLILDRLRPVGAVRAGYSYFANGDVAFAKVTPCFENGKGALMQGLVSGVGFGTTELTVLRPTPRLDARFLHYFLCSTAFRGPGAGAMTGAGGLKRVPDEFTRNTQLPLPPLLVQRRIANALDRETARIDALIEKKTRFIELLREKRQALITNALHGWERRPLKYVAEFITSGPRGWAEYLDDDGAALFVQSGDLNDALGVSFGTAARLHAPVGAESQRTALRSDDVIVCITGANTGRVAIARTPPKEAYINQHLCLIRVCKATVVPLFLALVLHSRLGREHFESRQYGLKEGLSLADVADTPIPVPSLARQTEIVRQIEEQATSIANVLVATDRSILLLRERRAALITAAVTGQIDLREPVPQPTSSPRRSREAAAHVEDPSRV